jgi:hypothetical protein
MYHSYLGHEHVGTLYTGHKVLHAGLSNCIKGKSAYNGQRVTTQ